MFLFSQQRYGSEETRGGREIKEEELERKRAEKKTKQEETTRGRRDGEGEGAEQGKETTCCVFLKRNGYRKSPLRRRIKTCLTFFGPPE